MAVSARVTAITWERVNLTLTVRFDEPPSGTVEFRLVEGKVSHPVRTEKASDSEFRLAINVTNFRKRQQVPNGTWRIVPRVNGKNGPAADYDLSSLARLDESSRVYLYDNNLVVYVVSFGISEDEHPRLLMRTYQLFRSAKKPAPGGRTLKEKIAGRYWSRGRRTELMNRWYRLSRQVSPPTGKRILFASQGRGPMGENLQRVHDRLVHRGLDKTYSIRRAHSGHTAHPRLETLWLIYRLATSDIVLIDNYFPLLDRVKPDPSTRLIQLWHAGSGFKNIGYSRFGNYGSPKLRNSHRLYTYAITGSANLVGVYAEAFGIEESAVIPTGLPRLDTFLDPTRSERARARFFEAYPRLAGKRLILLAPTFRGRGQSTAYYDYAQVDFAALHRMCGSHSVVLFRAHPFVPPPVPVPPEYADRVVDVTSFPGVNDLLHVSDILITDYSSIIYEYSLLDRPMLFFAPDRQAYAATRGFHRDFEDVAPGKICDTIAEVVKAIESEDYEQWKVRRFREENIDYVDTGSTDRVIDWLIVGDPPSAVRAGRREEQRV